MSADDHLTTNDVPVGNEWGENREYTASQSEDSTVSPCKEYGGYKRHLLRKTEPSPIRHLPTEVLQKIFLSCLSESIDGVQVLLNLVQVCTLWQEAAHSEPRLWICTPIINAPVRNSNRQALKGKAELLSSWIRRSGDVLPLTISVRQSESTSEDLESFLQPIQAVRHRWEKLNILDIQFNYLVDKLLGDSTSLAPRLKLIELHGDYRGAAEGVVERAVSIAPNLRSLVLTGDPVTHDITAISVRPIEELRLDMLGRTLWPFDLVISPIAKCSHLRRLDLAVCAFGFPEYGVQPTEYLTFPYLETLKFHLDLDYDLHGRSVHTFLNQLVAPKLHELDLSGLTYAIDIAQAIDNLTSRSSCSIQFLTLRNGELSESDSSESETEEDKIFRLVVPGSDPYPYPFTRTLLHLSLRNIPHSAGVSLLKSLIDDDSLCPELSHLSLNYEDHPIDLSPIQKFLIRRAGCKGSVSSKLRYFEAGWDSGLNNSPSSEEKRIIDGIREVVQTSENLTVSICDQTMRSPLRVLPKK